MDTAGRLIVVSNRLPVTLVQNGNAWETKRSAGGLATAMDSILRRSGGVWIGWSGSEHNEQAAAQLREQENCVAVDLPDEVAKKYYEGYANNALWPLFHNFTARLRFEAENWAAYREANERFCAAVVREYQHGDRIWVHDYHLMLLPRLLRERLPDAPVGFFLHIPFPTSDLFSILPRGDELLSGLLGSDLIAFQTHLHLQHFRRSLRRLLGIETLIDRVDLADREVRLEALPIGIAPEEFLGQTEMPEAQQQVEMLRSQYRERQLIVAIDRLDYTKGLPERLRTFQTILNTSPELRTKVVLLQVAVPSRENIGSYQDLRSEVHELVGEINGRFGTPDWVPVVYINRGISRPELVALYQVADVAWVSPLRDGMNLVAKEYVACKPDGDGVLILSSFAGAAAEMGEALLVNPFDEERTAAAVKRALTMKVEERRCRMSAMHERVLRTNVFVWGDRFLLALDDSVKVRRERSSDRARWAPVEDLVTRYQSAATRLLLFDYDGTLVPFASRPHEAAPDEELLLILQRLTADSTNSVLVLSGRKAADVDSWLGGVPELGLAAEHGSRWRMPHHSEWQGRPTASEWKSRVRPILEHFVERTPGSLIEEKEFALVWHYRLAEPEFGDWLATELVDMLERMLAETELRAYRGNKIVEVKPIWANKGAFVRNLLPQHSGANFVFCVGDDRTDEDMFGEFPPGAWTMHIGSGATRAAYRLKDTDALRHLLRQLTGIRS
jgi:trehalose 6-phosphate synthase/phosphatase